MNERAPKPGLPNSFWRVLELANDRIADKKKSKRKGSGTLVQQEDLSSKSKPVSGSRVPLAERLAQTDASEKSSPDTN